LPVSFAVAGIGEVLLSGIKFSVCPKCAARNFGLPARDKLFAAIAQAIVVKPTTLAGNEIRFLRRRLRMKASDYARLLGVTPQHYSRWENSRSLPARCTDRLIRMGYAFMLPDEKLTRAITTAFSQWTQSIEPERRNIVFAAEYNGSRGWSARTVEQPFSAKRAS
jgi:transcriptional regulator with XRE-family HTH domain